MPAPKKPTKTQIREALEDQNPQTSRVAPTTKPKTLKQAGLSGAGETLDYYKAKDWFDNESDETSQPFFMYSARLYTKGPYNDSVIFKLKDGEGNFSLCSLTANEPRMEFVKYFKTNTVPLGPLHFVQLDVGQASAYYDIQDAEDDEIPF